MKFYAAENTRGFSNTWEVLVFDNKQARNQYVSKRDGYNHHLQKVVDCRKIKKSQVKDFANYSMTKNRVIKPRPFSGECWMIQDHYIADASIPGYIGNVVVGIPGYDPGIRLF